METNIEASKLLRQGWAMLRAGDHNGALEISDQLFSEFDLSPQALLFAGEVHFARANFIRSEKIAATCIREFPDDLSGPVLRCRALLAMGSLTDGRDIALATARKDVSDEAHVEILNTVLSTCMEPEASYPLCKKSVERDPYNALAHRRLALNCRLTGRLEEAAREADTALRFNAHDYEMIGLRSAVQTATAENNHIVQLETMLASGCANALGGARVAYALAKECEEIGDVQRAFGFLEAGARFKRQTIKYSVSSDLQAMENVRETFSASALSASREYCDSGEPIFILGLPRTGSSLLERILGSHSEVYAAGELLHFSAAMMDEIRAQGTLKDHRDMLQKSLAANPRLVGESYLSRGRPFTGHTSQFIDKRPLNFFNIAMIHKALPNAKIIHIRRTPMDTCYAIYKFLFNEAYAWSYDLDEIAQYYIAYRRLMAHWREVLPDQIIEVTYEDIVNDIDNQSRSLLNALGLPWEPACLQFHLNQTAAMTGSAAQVRKKLYASSVGRWRSYEKQLEPLTEKLEAAGIDPLLP